MIDKIQKITMVPFGGVSDSTRSLTGSSTLLKIVYLSGKNVNILVDIGMFQGLDEVHNEDSFIVPASDIDVVLLTHNHADHIGLLPKLYSEGFEGKIYTHKNAIADLKHIFEDNLKIMETNIKIAISKRKALGKKMRIALSNVSGKSKRSVSNKVDTVNMQDTVIAYGFLHKHGITSKSDLKKFQRAEFKKINRNNNLRGAKKNLVQQKLDKLISDLDSSLEIVRNQDKKSVLSYDDSKKIVDDNNLKSSSDIDYALPKIPELLFSETDIKGVLSKIIGFEYNKQINILPGISISAYSAVHLPWSSQIVVNIHKESFYGKSNPMRDSKRILFSGDIGKIREFNLLGDLTFPEEYIDCALIENTYGDRNHMTNKQEDMQTFIEVYKTALVENGKILIPAFSNHRIHQVLYMINTLIENGDLPKEQKVHITSALGQKLHNNRLKNNPYIHGRFLKNKNFIWEASSFTLNGLSVKNDIVPIIVSSSGMIDGGSIMKQLEHFLPYKKNTLVAVGYMADGTYGRQIINGEEYIKPNHSLIKVNAKIVSLGSFSGHAGQDDLIFYQENLKLKKGAQIIYNHGDPIAVGTIMQRVEENKVNSDAQHIRAELNEQIIIYKADWFFNLLFVFNLKNKKKLVY